MRPAITAEAEAMIRFAQGVLKGYDGKQHGTAEALDWLLRDACEYDSPVVGAQARRTWPESVETREWERKRTTHKGTLRADAPNARQLATGGIVESSDPLIIREGECR